MGLLLRRFLFLNLGCQLEAKRDIWNESEHLYKSIEVKSGIELWLHAHQAKQHMQLVSSISLIHFFFFFGELERLSYLYSSCSRERERDWILQTWFSSAVSLKERDWESQLPSTITVSSDWVNGKSLSLCLSLSARARAHTDESLSSKERWRTGSTPQRCNEMTVSSAVVK